VDGAHQPLLLLMAALGPEEMHEVRSSGLSDCMCCSSAHHAPCHMRYSIAQQQLRCADGAKRVSTLKRGRLSKFHLLQ
jgi:hypothetical protein